MTTASRPYVSPRRAEGAQRTRERITQAVREMLEQGEFHAAAIDDVASRAGVSRATVYQHFGSRRGLVDGLCETIGAHPALLAIRAAVDALDVDGVIANGVRFWAAQEDVTRALYGMREVDDAAGDFVARQQRDRAAEMRRLARGLARAGRLRPELTERHAAARLIWLTSYDTYAELRRHAALSERAVRELLTDDARALTRQRRRASVSA